jgi:hypothetical protein
VQSCLTILMDSLSKCEHSEDNGRDRGYSEDRGCGEALAPEQTDESAPQSPIAPAPVVTAITALWSGLWVVLVFAFVWATVLLVKTIFGWFDIY